MLRGLKEKVPCAFLDMCTSTGCKPAAHRTSKGPTCRPTSGGGTGHASKAFNTQQRVRDSKILRGPWHGTTSCLPATRLQKLADCWGSSRRVSCPTPAWHAQRPALRPLWARHASRKAASAMQSAAGLRFASIPLELGLSDECSC